MGTSIDNEIWIDDPSNRNTTVLKDPATQEVFNLEPPKNGSCMRVWTFYPDNWKHNLSKEQLDKNLSRFNAHGLIEDKSKPGVHITKTIDYGIVLEGEIDLILDEGTVHLKKGDVIVQRGTSHAWHNIGAKPCTIAFILINSPNY
ncbi:MAG TPA: hypothetical protein DD381_06170 [Lentisphaeria bacterium]|nr:MAG: hypothetical protein A2X47_05245 [Lentisphaerae bacterium GWF2_38_69]HBM15912.1 hypothetical protein [Lentisphaeria bacterium]